MLRYGFLASDFHPQFLVLGERSDFEQLADLLTDFARDPRDLVIPRSCGTAPETEAELRLSFSEEAPGLRAPSDRRVFEWKLDARWAETFAASVLALARAPAAAASELLEIGGDLNEVPVKVSRGEFTDDFLIDKS